MRSRFDYRACMRKRQFVFSPIAAALFAVAAPAAADTCEATSGARVLPLVELYTAEGCSDCPPADRWLSELSRRLSPGDAAMLAFHVDYWDKEGWPDRFGDARHSQRQDLRITLAGKRVTYTPQVMVGKDVNAGWRNDGKFDALLRQARARTAPLSLSLRVARPAGALQVAVDAKRQDAAAPTLVWLALYQDGLVSHIAEGENKGRTLHHDRVVRALAGPWRMEGAGLAEQARIPLPDDAEPARMGLVLFAESAKSGEGLQAVALPLAQCPEAGKR